MTRHVCDVPGCGAPRKRWQRLCARCFARLPGEIRVGIEEAYHQRRYADHAALKRRAREFLGPPGSAARTAPSLPPETAYAQIAARLGERQ